MHYPWCRGNCSPLLHAGPSNGFPAIGWGEGIRFPPGRWVGVGSAPAEDMPPGGSPPRWGVGAYPPPTDVR